MAQALETPSELLSPFEIQDKFDLSASQFLAMRSVVQFANIFLPDAQQAASALLGLKLLGYFRKLDGDLPDHVNARQLYQLLKSPPVPEFVEKDRIRVGRLCIKLAKDIQSISTLAESLIVGDFTYLESQYAKIGKENLKILKNILLHNAELSDLDREVLETRFPFAPQKYQYFDYFLSSHEGRPNQAFRHLTTSVSFFAVAKGVIDTLHNSQFGIVKISYIDPSLDRQTRERLLNECIDACIRCFSGVGQNGDRKEKLSVNRNSTISQFHAD